jgi:NTE family protein
MTDILASARQWRCAIVLLAVAALGLAAYGWRPSGPVVLDYEHLPRPVDARMVGAYPNALVLGSGGPRGLAHIGVLQVLQAAGYKPDLVVGASMGALVGALMSAGRSADEMEQRVLDPDVWNWLRDLTWSRQGWLRGDAIERILRRAGADVVLEDLPLRVVAVATQLPAGERVEFGYGDAISAVRASSASPGMFVPVVIGGRLYADGDIVAPVPVDTARRLGARRIIAVDVSAFADTTPPADQMTMEWVQGDIRRRLLIERELPAADAVIRVRMPYYLGLGEESRATAIEAGRQAARAALPQLRRLGLVPESR